MVSVFFVFSVQGVRSIPAAESIAMDGEASYWKAFSLRPSPLMARRDM